MENCLLTHINELNTVELIATTKLKPHENFDLKNMAYWLEQIKDENFWTDPILIERENKIIMDGHHRHQVALALNLKYIPCVLTTYANPYLTIYDFKMNTQMACEKIIQAGKYGILLAKKSSRHKLAFSLPKVKIPLSMLQ